MNICARYVDIQVVKRFESPKALNKFPVIIIMFIIIMFIIIIMLLVLLILCRACVCKVHLGLTLDVSAVSTFLHCIFNNQNNM